MVRAGWICGGLAALAGCFASGAAAAAAPRVLEPAAEESAAHPHRAAATRSLDLEPAPLAQWTAAAGPAAAEDGSTRAADPRAAELRFGATLKVNWETPGLTALARNFQRQGLPIVPLWQNSQSLLALGLDRKGVLGLYLRPKSE